MNGRVIRGAAAAGTIAALALAGTAIGGDSAPRAVTVTTVMTGEAEVPGPGDKNGRGTAEVKLKKQKGKVCFDLTWRKIEDPSASHIHKGGTDVAGPVKIELFSGLQTSPVSDCVKAGKRLIGRIAKRPGRFYVNVHNSPFPDGAIRGQLDFPVG